MQLPGILRWLLLLLVLPAPLHAQSCKEAVRLLRVLENYHYRPLPVDDTLSAHLFDNLLNALDPDRLLFLQEDIERLTPYRLRLDDALPAGDCAFMEVLAGIYQLRLQRADSLLDQLGGRTFAAFSGSASTFALDEAALANRWEGWIAREALSHPNPHTVEADREKERYLLLEKAIQKEHCNLKATLLAPEGIGVYLYATLLNTLTQCFDPHTTYFSARELESFEASLSREALSFGVEFDRNEEGDIEISHLTPGGPAWKSNQLNKGDVLLKVRLPDGTYIDLLCADVMDMEEQLQTSHADSLQFTVKKRSGQVRTVTLYKEKIEVEENAVAGFLLEGKIRAGYIYLPGFYTEWENQEGKGCAEDVARELLKLQMEGMEGLILDLRYNGGGSVKEAMDLAGIFIQEGALCLYQGKEREPGLMKDANRGTMYDGPLVLLVNGMSASASEMLAAALQDYHRALILGSPTYGKASGQQVLPLGISREAGFVKITTQRYYRLNGSSLQRTGVAPDVPLPEPLGFYLPREAHYPTALPGDSVKKQVSYRALAPLPVERLAQLSRDRIGLDPRFQQVNSLNQSLAHYFDGQTLASREPSDSGRQEALAQLQALDSLLNSQSTPVFQVKNHQFNSNLIEMDAARKLINAYQLGKIQQDLLLEEAYLVLADLAGILRH